MELMKVPATPRSTFGKGPSRRMRADGKIPAVVYGSGQETQSVSVAPKDLVDVLESRWGRNSVIELEVEGGSKQNVLLADFQYHPVSRTLLHADFLRLADDQLVDVDIPFETKGRAPGVVLGGRLAVVYRKLPVRCKPSDIPEKLVLDVTGMGLDAHVSVADLELPEGVEVRLRPAQKVASIVSAKRGREGADESAEGAEGDQASTDAGK